MTYVTELGVDGMRGVAYDECMTTADDIHFAHFMDKVDSCLDDLAGVTHLDLPDIDYHARYDAGMPAHQVAQEALKEAGSF